MAQMLDPELRLNIGYQCGRALVQNLTSDEPVSASREAEEAASKSAQNQKRRLKRERREK
jgi:hypothetical protein